jgi:hypothetical protein
MPRVIADVHTMIVECNPPALRLANTTADELVAFLSTAGFSTFVIDERARRLEPWVPLLVPEDGYRNLAATRNPERLFELTNSSGRADQR